MTKQLVSIVIPCYNYGRFIPEAIDSALEQSYSPIEIIVIDDGSTDDTAQVVKRYGKKVSYYHQENGGLSAARNTGITHCKGKYIVFLDSDDKLAKTFVEEAVVMLERNPDKYFVYTQLKTFGRESEVSTFSQYNERELKEHNYINAGALLRATVFQNTAYSPAMRAGWEDWDFYISLAENGYTGILLDKPLLLYRKHADMSSMSDMMAGDRLQRRLMLRLISRHVGFFGVVRLGRMALYNIRRDIQDLLHQKRKGGQR